MITDWHLTELFSKLLLWLKMFRNFITCIFQNLTDIYQTLEEFLIRKKTIWFTALVKKDYKNFGRINSNLNSNQLMKKMNWKSRTTFKIKSVLLLNYLWLFFIFHLTNILRKSYTINWKSHLCNESFLRNQIKNLSLSLIVQSFQGKY